MNEWAVPPQKTSTRVKRTILHCHWGDTPQILIQMYHTKGSMDSIQHSLADDSSDNYSKHKKGHRKIKACFSLKKYLICTQQYILYQLYRTSCMKITDNCRTGGNSSFATLTFHLKQFLNFAKRLRGATWLVTCSISKWVVHNKGCNLEISRVRFS